MSITSFLTWLENTDLFMFIGGSAYAFPVILALHLVCISMFAGMILVTDVRILGWGMRSQPVSEIVNQLRWPKRVGFTLVATCGILLFGSKAEEYYRNPFFRTKLLLLALIAIHALVFRRRLYHDAAELDRRNQVPLRAKLAAALSLFLWVTVACAGRAIASIPAPHGLHYR